MKWRARGVFSVGEKRTPGGTLSFVAKKTGQRLTVPLAKVLVDYLTELPATDSPNAPVFPKLSTKTASKLSEGFRSVLAEAGLAEPVKNIPPARDGTPRAKSAS